MYVLGVLFAVDANMGGHVGPPLRENGLLAGTTGACNEEFETMGPCALTGRSIVFTPAPKGIAVSDSESLESGMA